MRVRNAWLVYHVLRIDQVPRFLAGELMGGTNHSSKTSNADILADECKLA